MLEYKGWKKLDSIKRIGLESFYLPIGLSIAIGFIISPSTWNQIRVRAYGKKIWNTLLK